MRGRKKHAAVIVILVLAILGGMVALFIHSYEQYMKTAYPLQYEDIIYEMSEEYAITPSLIAAVICVESHFQPEATSHAGAIGLMQLTPETFTWAQVRAGITDTADETALTDPQTNIRYGTFTLKLLYEMFEDETAALAAYNAGQGTVSKWLANTQYSADGIHLDKIPYEETAMYVKRVKSAQTIYRQRYFVK